ncbi:restriction endonuclease subunit S [Prevotella melaninogenica]|uniref:restriction endonuclease subunit S n=1 Tax=Prevotella melaninogenica TaxID=28132 RepID=UPI00242DC823|nr:restriction endonuclease subunit S [Prevotella melaninogenica]
MTTTIDNEHKIFNVPNLRFPEFEGEWQETRLKEISKFSKERLNSIELSCSNYVTTENMLQDYKGIVSATNLPTNTNVVKFSKGDVLLSNIRPYLKKVWYADRNGGCSADVFVFKALPICDSNFLHHVIANDRFIKFVMGGAKGVKMPRGDKEQMITYKVGLPCIEEQKKIANLLSLLDERISTQNKIIEDLKKLKCAIIEKLYSEIQGKEYLYGQLFEVVNKRNKQVEYSNILSASQEKGMVNRDDLNLDIQFERSNINTYKIVRAGDYVIHLRSFQGGFAFSDKLGVCSPAYTILRPNSLLEYGYLSYYFTSHRFIKSLIIVTYGIRDGRSINIEEWLNMKVIIPSKEHQLHTLKILRSLEGKIENEETYTICLSNQKQYLLQQMFI